MPTQPSQAGRLVAELIRDPAGLEPLRARWRELAQERGNAFLTPDWHDAWWRHYGHGATQAVVALRDESGELAGVMPMAISGRALRFAGSSVADHLHPVCREGDDAAVAAAAAPALALLGRGWSTMVFENVDAGAPWVEAFVAAWPRRLARSAVRPTVLPYTPLEVEDWDAWLATRSRNFRSQVGRRTRALERDHEATFRRTEDAAGLRADMDTFFALHDARWTERGGSTSESERVRAFHADFAAEALEQGWLRLWFLTADGTDVAAWYGWHVGGSYAYYLAGFDPDWGKASVGLVLLARTVRAAFEDGAAVYDLLLGDEDYKSRFATAERQVESVVLTRPLHPARLATVAEKGARRLAAALPEGARERAKSAGRRVIDRLPSARER